MKVENLHLINKTSTSRIIFTFLSKCNPISNTTNLVTFKEFLEDKFQINSKDFYQTFDDLEDQEVGSFSSAQPNVFTWHYNLKDVSEQIVYPNKQVTIREAEEATMSRKPRNKIISKPLTFRLKEVAPIDIKVDQPTSKVERRGRPKGAKNKPKVTKSYEYLTPKKEVKREGLITGEVIFFFTNKIGKRIPFRLDDVEDLVAQAKEVQSVLNISL